MDVPTSEALVRPVTSTEKLIKPVPKPFSIEALIGDDGPRRKINNPWDTANQYHQQNHQSTRDTDSDGSLDMDLAQDLSRRSQRDGKIQFVN